MILKMPSCPSITIQCERELVSLAFLFSTDLLSVDPTNYEVLGDALRCTSTMEVIVLYMSSASEHKKLGILECSVFLRIVYIIVS